MNTNIKRFSLLFAIFFISFLFYKIEDNSSVLKFKDISNDVFEKGNNFYREECLRNLRLKDSIERINGNSLVPVDELRLDDFGNISGEFTNLPTFHFSDYLGDCTFPVGVPAVAVGDVNNDNYPDIVKSPNLLYINKNGNSFDLVKLPVSKSFNEQEGKISTIPVNESWPSTPVISDLDQDGDVEILFTNRISVGGQQIVVFTQDIKKNWVLDKSYRFDFGSLSYFPNAQTFTVFDFNNDRLPDILLGFFGGNNFLYNKDRGLSSPGIMLLLNKGNKMFEDITNTFNLNNKFKNVIIDNLYVGSRTKFVDPITFVHGFSTNDFNNDGYIDIFVAGDFGTGVMLYNKNGLDLEVDQSNNFFGHSLMGPASIDYNGDGVLDIYASQVYQEVSTRFVCESARMGCDSKLGNNFWISEGPGKWVDKSLDVGVRKGGWGWGTAIADLNNDGKSEIIQTNGTVNELSPAETGWNHRWDPINLFYENNDGIFEDIGRESGLFLPFSTASVGTIDVNLDGLLDVVIASGFELKPRVFINKSSNKGNYISILVKDKNTSANILNAKVEVKGYNKKWFMYSGNSNQSHFSNSDTSVRFGVGDNKKVDITVYTLDGKVVSLKNQSVNKNIIIKI